jgi:hypothetical protein
MVVGRERESVGLRTCCDFLLFPLQRSSHALVVFYFASTALFLFLFLSLSLFVCVLEEPAYRIFSPVVPCS